jgi:hypothetical protein
MELEIEEEKLTWRRGDEASSQRPPVHRCCSCSAGGWGGGAPPRRGTLQDRGADDGGTTTIREAGVLVSTQLGAGAGGGDASRCVRRRRGLVERRRSGDYGRSPRFASLGQALCSLLCSHCWAVHLLGFVGCISIILENFVLDKGGPEPSLAPIVLRPCPILSPCS